MKIVTDNTVPQTSQEGTVKNTVSHPHKASHKVADELIKKHDTHAYDQNQGRKVHNTSSVGTDIATLQDGRDEQTPVEKA